MRLKEKVCIITGAGSGIGKATALLFAKEGAIVIACDVNPDGLEKLVDESKDLNGKIIPYVLDVTDRNRINEVVKDVVECDGEVRERGEKKISEFQNFPVGEG